MPSPDDSTPVPVPNAFHPDFLAQLASQDDPLLAAEAAHGGIWRVRPIGRLRYRDPELIEALNLAEALARSPESIAALLEGAGHAALEPAGKIVVRGMMSA